MPLVHLLSYEPNSWLMSIGCTEVHPYLGLLTVISLEILCLFRLESQFAEKFNRFSPHSVFLLNFAY